MGKHFKTYATNFNDPSLVDTIDDATEVYGDWPDVVEPCSKSPSRVCEYSVQDPDHCKHCGRGT